MELVAEEAAGHVLKQALLNRNNAPSKPLFRRMVDFIVNLFKGVNPGYYADAIDAVTKDMSSIADNILSSKTTITKQDVAKAKRDATFNALSEKEKKQVEVLKGIVERSSKAAALQKNLVERAEKETIQMEEYRHEKDPYNPGHLLLRKMLPDSGPAAPVRHGDRNGHPADGGAQYAYPV